MSSSHAPVEDASLRRLAVLLEQGSERERVFARLRAAKSWWAVGEILQQYGLSVIGNHDELFAVNFEKREFFALADCGHNMQVFEERLGPYPNA